MTDRPALDALGEEVRGRFLRELGHSSFRAIVLADKPALAAASVEFLRTGDLFGVDSLIRELLATVGIEDPLARAEAQAQALHLPTTVNMAPNVAADVLTTFEQVRDWLADTCYTWLDNNGRGDMFADDGPPEVAVPDDKRDAQIASVLLELFHMGYEEFDPTDPVNALGYNAADGLPARTEVPDFPWATRQTPSHYLSDLIATAVVARLMRTSGRELLVAWAEAVQATKA